MPLNYLIPEDTVISKYCRHEAEAQTDEILLKIHQHSDLSKHNLTIHQEEQDLNEDNLYTDFLDDQNPDCKILILEGPPGSGKTHIIRWVDIRIKSDENKYEIIRIRKGEKLSVVLKSFLSKVTDDNLLVKSQNIENNLSDLTPFMGAYLGYITDFLRQEVGSLPKDEIEKRFIMENLLKILAEPKYKEHLLKPNGKLAQLLSNASNGLDTFTDETLCILPDDLKCEGYQNVLYQSLILNAKYLEVAVNTMQNASLLALEQLVKSRSGNIDYSEIILNIRKALFKKKELIILVEDLSTMNGISRDFYTAISTSSYQDGRQYLCPIRTLIAVTSDFPVNWETIKSRAKHKWVINTDQSKNKRKSENFISGYLKAMNNAHTDPIPDLFLSDDKENQLFPFNSRFISVLTGSYSKFNPRYLINEVLTKYLPGLRIQDNLKLVLERTPKLVGADGTLQAELYEVLGNNKSDIENYQKFFYYYIGERVSLNQESIAKEDYEIFGLNNISRTNRQQGVITGEPQLTPTPNPHPPKADSRVERFNNICADLDEWRDTYIIDHTFANGVKDELVKQLMKYIHWESELIFHPEDHTPDNRYIFISKFGTQRANLDNARLILETEDSIHSGIKRTEFVEALKAVLYLQVYRDFKEGPNWYIKWSNLMERYKPIYLNYLQNNVGKEAKRTVEDLFRKLRYAGIVLGYHNEKTEDPELKVMQLILSDKKFDKDKFKLVPDWQNFLSNQYTEYQKNRHLLAKLFTARQGETGDSRILAFDIAGIMKLRQTKQASDEEQRELIKVTDKCVRSLNDHYEKLKDSFGDEVDLNKTIDSIMGTFPNVNVLPPTTQRLKGHEWIKQVPERVDLIEIMSKLKKLTEENLDILQKARIIAQLDFIQISSAVDLVDKFTAHYSTMSKGYIDELARLGITESREVVIDSVNKSLNELITNYETLEKKYDKHKM